MYNNYYWLEIVVLRRVLLRKYIRLFSWLRIYYRSSFSSSIDMYTFNNIHFKGFCRHTIKFRYLSFISNYPCPVINFFSCVFAEVYITTLTVLLSIPLSKNPTISYIFPLDLLVRRFPVVSSGPRIFVFLDTIVVLDLFFFSNTPLNNRF